MMLWSLHCRLSELLGSESWLLYLSSWIESLQGLVCVVVAASMLQLHAGMAAEHKRQRIRSACLVLFENSVSSRIQSGLWMLHERRVDMSIDDCRHIAASPWNSLSFCSKRSGQDLAHTSSLCALCMLVACTESEYQTQ